MADFRGEVDRVLSSSMPRLEKAATVASLIRSHGGFHWVGLYDVSPSQISAIAWTGDQAPAFPSFPISQGLNGAAVSQRAPVVVQDVSRDPRYLTTFGATRSEAIFPVLSADSGRVVGTIDVESDRTDAFDPWHEAFLRECAELLRPLWQGAAV